MNLSVTLSGFDSLIQSLDPARLRTTLSDSVDKASQLVRDDAKRMTPVSAATTGYAAIGIPTDTGRMRASIQARKTGELEAEVYADTNYSIFVQDGTRKMPARPFFLWLLESETKERILDLFDQAINELYG